MKALLLMLLLGLGSSLAAQELKIATIAPDGSSWMNELRQAGDEIAARSDNRIRVRYYPGGVMGDASAVLRRMRLGQLQGGAFTLGDLAQVSDVVNLYSLPFVFADEQELLRLRREFDPLIIQGLAEAGIIVPGLSLGGFAYLFSRQPFPDSTELSTSWRVWVPAGDVLSRRTLEKAGVTPVPLPLAEVYTALQTGAINTFASTPSAAIILQWHSRARHMLDLPVLMTVGTIGLDQRAMSRLAASDRNIVLDAFAATLERVEQTNREDNFQALKAIQRQGITVKIPGGGQVEAWQALASRTRQEMFDSGQISVPHLERLESALERIRD